MATLTNITGPTGPTGFTGPTGANSPPTAVAALCPDNTTLADATATINTNNKVLGKLVVITDPANRYIYATSGSNATDTWWSVTGQPDITPS